MSNLASHSIYDGINRLNQVSPKEEQNMSQVKEVDCFKKSVKLGELQPGSLFSYKGTVAFKSEYCTNGKPDCYIVGSGEAFCGPKIDDIRELSVMRVKTLSLF